MDQSPGTIGQMIARSAGAFERRRTKHEREWVAVFMNEDTITIALHGALTAEEKDRAGTPVGTAAVFDFHRQLFATDSAPLFRRIKSITGMAVCGTTAEIDPSSGSVVQVITTDTVPKEFLMATGGPTGNGAPRRAPPHPHKTSARQEANKIAGYVIRG
jgi:Na+-translocating membrane potential-generating system (MpsC)